MIARSVPVSATRRMFPRLVLEAWRPIDKKLAMSIRLTSRDEYETYTVEAIWPTNIRGSLYQLSESLEKPSQGSYTYSKLRINLE